MYLTPTIFILIFDVSLRFSKDEDKVIIIHFKSVYK